MLLRTNKQAGISIIELFVVIALLGLALSIITSAIVKTKARTRDAKRITDVQVLIKTLHLYYLNKQHFPIVRNSVTIDGQDVLSKVLSKDGLIRTPPLDPLFPTYGISLCE